MPKLTLQPLSASVNTLHGETVRDTLQRMGIEIDSPCNGQGICGKCTIRTSPPENAPETPHPHITDAQSAQGIRLACRLVPDRDLIVQVESDSPGVSQRILEGARFPRKNGDTQCEARSRRAVVTMDPALRTGIAPAARILTEGGSFSLAYEGQATIPEIEWSAGRNPKGIAVDIGTTTLVVSLVRLKDGRELSTHSRLNPQIQYGHDIMSRIRMGSDAEGLRTLSHSIRESLNDLIAKVCGDSRSHPREIVDGVVGGNTTMLQLLAQIDPSPLGAAPFTASIQGGRTDPAADFGLHVHPHARVYIPPVPHAFVGADMSAGLLVCKDFFEPGRSILFIDIGTNGEMALSTDQRWYVTSTAAGPAFEGMGIRCGMRAQVGAVEAVTMDARGMTLTTIGNGSPKGICGSGIIDIAANLIRIGVVEDSGRMRRPAETDGLPRWAADRLLEIDGKAAFRIAADVFFTQEDVRQVQLAKSAVAAAIDILLNAAGIGANELSRITIAGGFGYFLKTDSLETLGLLPPETGGKVEFAGNTCRMGCIRLLGSFRSRRWIEQRMQKVTHLPVESSPDFMDRYVEKMAFPQIDSADGMSPAA